MADSERALAHPGSSKALHGKRKEMRRTAALGWESAWPAAPESVAEIRHAVARTAREAGLGELRLHELRLAVTEVCANAIMHAATTSGLTVAVEADDAVCVTVRDHGGGLRPRSDSPGAGFGLSIVCNVADDLEIDSPPGGGTRLRMAFRLPA